MPAATACWLIPWKIISPIDSANRTDSSNRLHGDRTARIGVKTANGGILQPSDALQESTMNRNQKLLYAFLFAMAAMCRPANSQGLMDSRPAPAPPQPTQLSPASLMVRGATADYVLGAGDQITVASPGLEDQYNEKVFRIDASGDVTLPLVGRIHAAGLSTGALEGELQLKLKPVLKEPKVVVGISSYGSEPVSVLGSVRNPGIVQLQGRRTLFEVLSMAGGLQPDAGYVAQVTRPLRNGNIPLPNVRTDEVNQVSVAAIRLKDIINVPNAAENIEILPGDAVSVPKAGLVYVVGSVTKPGGYTLDENESLSTLQVLSLSEGLLSTSASSKARILRSVPGSPSRAEIPVNLNRLMAGKASDVPLQAGDILFVPVSNAKKVSYRGIEAMITAATYIPVYAGF
jgi:polysaccharide export outer membrane protein